MAWWQYLLLVNVYLVLFYGFYVLLLSKETFFGLNRTYLISSAVLSFVIPVIQTDWVHNLFVTQKLNQTIYSLDAVVISAQLQQSEIGFSLGQIFAVVYLVVTLFLMLKLIYQLLKLKQAFNNPTTGNAFSFFGKISINQGLSQEGIIASHEKVHARQWHSADVILIEMVTIINWFNPIVYLYRKAIKHIHEFIADNEIVTHGTTKQDYAMLLLSQTLNTPVNQLANTFFNHSLLKQRIMMLHKNPSQRKALVKYGLSAPLFVLMVILSSATAKTNKAITAINKKAAQVMQIRAIIKHDGGKIVTATAAVKQPPVAITKQTNQPALQAVQVKEEILAEAPDTTDKNKLFTSVEQSAMFPGGLNEFYQFLAKNIRYPAEARINKVQGRVICQFNIEQDGSITDVRVIRGVGSGLDVEAIRVLSIMPKWEPGRQNGHVIRQQYTVPILFTLQSAAPQTIPDGQRKDPPPPPSKPAGQTEKKITFIKVSPVNGQELHIVPDNVLKGTMEITHTDTLNLAEKLMFNNKNGFEYFVDSKKVNGMKDVDLNTIESIEVFKTKPGTKSRIVLKLKKK